MAIDDKIQMFRKQHGWSRQQLAKKLAGTFDVTLDYLVDDTGKAAEIKDKACSDASWRPSPGHKRSKKPLCMCSTAC